MSKVQIMRELVNQRLAAAAEEIFGLFERTIAEYEEELCRSKEKNERQQKLLDAVLKPEVRLHRADVQQLVVAKVALENKEVECDAVKTSVGASECATSSDHKGQMQQRKGTQTEWRLDQEDPPQPPHIKEEQEELWTSQEGEQLQGLEEADITKFLFTPVHVKSEDDEEKPQSSQLHQRQTEQMETGADGEDCGGPEPARNSHPDPRLRPRQVSLYDSGCKTNEQQPSCSVCGKMVIHQSSLQNHILKTHTKNESFGCSECGKVFSVKGSLKVHMRIHTGEKPYSCDVCGERFTYKETLATHVTKHTREKKCWCLVCGKSFRNLTRHMMSHTAEKPFSCSTCGKRFTARKSWRLHKAIHTGEKRFCCRVCDQRFTWCSQLTRHKCISPQSSQLHQNQTEENRETQSSLTFENNNEASESGVKPFSCSVCGKRFTRKENSKKHMMDVHTQENKFRNVSDQRFASDSQLRRHKCIGPQSSQLLQIQTEQMETGADGEDCGGPEPARNSHPDPEFGPVSEDETEDSSETDDSSDWEENSESQSASNSLQSYEKYLNEVGFYAVKTSVSFSECATSSGYLQGMHTEIQGHPYRRETI